MSNPQKSRIQSGSTIEGLVRFAHQAEATVTFLFFGKDEATEGRITSVSIFEDVEALPEINSPRTFTGVDISTGEQVIGVVALPRTSCHISFGYMWYTRNPRNLKPQRCRYLIC